MKKLCACAACILVLFGAVCLPVGAATPTIGDSLSEASDQMRQYAEQFRYEVVMELPAKISPLLLVSVTVEADGATRPIEDVADCTIRREDGEDVLGVVPKQAEYATALLCALHGALPFCTVNEEPDSQTGIPCYTVCLPEMTRDLYEASRKYLDSTYDMAKKKTELCYLRYKGKILAAGGKDSLAELDALYESSVGSLNEIYEEYADTVEKRYEAYCDTHPGEAVAKLASSLSQGNPALIMGILGLAIGMTAMFFIMRKQRRTNP